MPRLEPEVAPINTLPEVAPNNAARAEPRWRRAALSGATSGDVLIGANSDSERGVYTATERRIGRLAAETRLFFGKRIDRWRQTAEIA